MPVSPKPCVPFGFYNQVSCGRALNLIDFSETCDLTANSREYLQAEILFLRVVNQSLKRPAESVEVMKELTRQIPIDLVGLF